MAYPFLLSYYVTLVVVVVVVVIPVAVMASRLLGFNRSWTWPPKRRKEGLYILYHHTSIETDDDDNDKNDMDDDDSNSTTTNDSRDPLPTSRPSLALFFPFSTVPKLRTKKGGGIYCVPSPPSTTSSGGSPFLVVRHTVK